LRRSKMNYLAIDLHKNQITVNMRNEEGTVLFKKQISTHHNKIDEFFKGIAEQSANHDVLRFLEPPLKGKDRLAEEIKVHRNTFGKFNVTLKHTRRDNSCKSPLKKIILNVSTLDFSLSLL
ncbi:MAG: hypothetical protein PHQ75_11615, partial [Thermoguttaceae bacterium]|nr:hypothetical protein [Thermoguttaceae bacterium]